MSNYYYAQQGYSQPGRPLSTGQYSASGHERPPPSYQFAGDESVEYLEAEDERASDGFEYVYPGDHSGGPSNTSPQRKQSRSMNGHNNAGSNDNQYLTPGGAGVGAGSNAYRRPSEFDSPSVYTDPYDWQSNGGHSTAYTVTPNPQAPSEFLDHDPYDGNRQRHTQQGSQDLYRKDTLRPGDSISVYNVPAPAPRATAGYAGGGWAGSDGHGYAHNGGDDYDEDGYKAYTDGRHNRQDTSMSGAGYAYPVTAAAPYTNAADFYSYGNGPPPVTQRMDFADDEYDQDRRLKHASYYDDGGKDEYGMQQHQQQQQQPPPGLFSNQMPMPGSDAEAAGGGGGGGGLSGKSGFDDHEDGSKRGLLGLKRDPLDTQIEKRRRGIGRQRWPIVSWILSVAFVAVFIVGLIKAKKETGQAVQTKPYVNPMLGPSSQFQISFGARFVPCMRKVPAVPTTLKLPCLKDSTKATVTTDQACELWEICGLKDANSVGQAYRFVTPIFLHAGFVHIIFNLLVQLTLCSQIEKLLGSVFFVIIYIAGGIGGNLLGGNFGLVATPSVGASGSIYTCISVEIVDLVYNWKYEYRAKTRLVTSILFTIIGLAVGLLPGLDNFAHIGGLAVGILGGLLFAPAIHTTRTHRITVWVLRVAALAALVGFFVALTTNFYNSDEPTKACTWCRYLSCLPTFKQCQNNGLTMTNASSGTSRRDLFLL